MLFLDCIYQIFIAPLELFFQVVYAIFYSLSGNPGTSIVPLSITVNVLLLPFYNRADDIQKAQHELDLRMKPGIDHIKRTFKGDERHMMLQNYYRLFNNKPTSSLKSAIPLLLEIPFFIAAFHFLSNLSLLNGKPFMFLADLGKPDGLIEIGGISVNLLPIVMTIINIVSSEIYLRNPTPRERFQQYGMALAFLILLYNSPSGLVVYWTLNNLFSLCKNLINLTQNRGDVITAVLSCISVFVLACGVWYYINTGTGLLLSVILMALLQMPLVKKILDTRLLTTRDNGLKTENKTLLSLPQLNLDNVKPNKRLFFIGAISLTVLLGVLIPSTVVLSSPAEFVILTDYHPPIVHVVNSFLLATGTFIVWLGLFYYLANSHMKLFLEILVLSLCANTIVNYMVFGVDSGALTNMLRFEQAPSYSATEFTIGWEVVLLTIAVIAFIRLLKERIVKVAFPIVLVSLSIMAIGNTIGIVSSEADLETTLQQIPEDKPSFQLSTKGKNIIVLMLDRAIGAYLPYLFAERPELQQQFDGFTYYPNTISYGPHTNIGTPCLFGGYDYTPEQMNSRADLSLEEKQNEALKVLPKLFSEAGYEVTVCDPPYAGYSWIPDLSIYEDLPNVRTFVTETGAFDEFASESNEEKISLWKRNFFMYAIMKSTPPMLQMDLYDGGAYMDPNKMTKNSYGIQFVKDRLNARGVDSDFLDSYGVLSALPELTYVDDETSTNTFLMMSNSTTHDVMMLQEPEYTPSLIVDNTEYEKLNSDRFTLEEKTMHMNGEEEMKYYQCNMAALLKVGEWLDGLRDKGVFDNTRIIVVADHGFHLPQFDSMLFGSEYWENAMFYNPLLLVKDFDSSGFTVDNTFMTNADTPTLAMSSLLEYPVNPFTGNRISSSQKELPEQHILFTEEWKTDVNNGNTFLPGTWYSVHDDIFNKDNWNKIGEW